MKSGGKKSTWVERRKIWIKNNRIKWEVLLLLVGAVIGFVLSMGWGYWQDCQTDKFTAQNIYMELNNPKNPVNLHAPEFINGKTHEGIPIQPVMVYGDSFFLTNSVFPSINDKLQRFDSKLAGDIHDYYENLSEAEKYRLELLSYNNVNGCQNANISYHDQIVLDLSPSWTKAMEARIINCSYLIPVIKSELKQKYNL